MMQTGLIRLRRYARQSPAMAWRTFCDGLLNQGQFLTLASALVATWLLVKVGGRAAMVDELTNWSAGTLAFTYVAGGWAAYSLLTAPIRILRAEKSRGSWEGHHFIYHEPLLIGTWRFEDTGGTTQTREIVFDDAEPFAFVHYRLEALPPANDRILAQIGGGRPNHNYEIPPRVPGMFNSFAAPPTAYVGIRLPNANTRATLYVRLEPATVPIVIRAYCNEFFVGKDDSSAR